MSDDQARRETMVDYEGDPDSPWIRVWGDVPDQQRNAADYRAAWLLGKHGPLKRIPWPRGSVGRAAYMASRAYQKERRK